MTREERENALHCLKVMIDEEVCEECNLYGTTGTDHCEADCVRVAIKALDQDPILDTRQRERQLEMEYQHGYDKGWEEGRKALEQQPCENCISKQAVLRLVEQYPSIIGSRCVGLMADIKHLPPVTPKAEWIPVSERLPEKDGEYLVYGKVVDENEDNHIFIGLYDEGSEGFGWWQDYYDNKTLGFLDSDFTEYASVLAWMPLPSSYQAESEDEE